MAKTNSHLEEGNFIERKFYGKVEIERAWSFLYFQQQGIAQDIIHHLKYENCPEVGVLIGKRYGLDLKDKIFEYAIDYVIPVPLHYKKHKSRGYNQSEMFAKGLSDSLGIPLLNALQREKDTKTQTKKSRIQRWQNVESIFTVKDFSVTNKNVLLVDDVVTTGSTLESCAETLINNNCKVFIATLAAAK